MASEDEKAFKNCLYDHVDFIKEYILENAQNHDCAEKMRFILSLIVGDQQLSEKEVFEIDKTVKILKENHPENKGSSKPNESNLIQMLDLKRRTLSPTRDLPAFSKRIKEEPIEQPCTSSSVLEPNCAIKIEKEEIDDRSSLVTIFNFGDNNNLDIHEERLEKPFKLQVPVINFNKYSPKRKPEEEVAEKSRKTRNSLKQRLFKKISPVNPILPSKNPDSFIKITKSGRVCNMSYQRCNNLEFICHLKECESRPHFFNDIIFDAHVRTKHAKHPWDGSCLICKDVSNPGTISDEYEHLNTVHFNKKKEIVNVPPPPPILESILKIKQAKKPVEIKKVVDERYKLVSKRVSTAPIPRNSSKIQIVKVCSVKENPGSSTANSEFIAVKEEKFEVRDVVQVVEVKEVADFVFNEEKSLSTPQNMNNPQSPTSHMFETTIVNVPMMKMPGIVVNTYEQRNGDKELDESPNHNVLRPWLKGDCYKLKDVSDLMLQLDCLKDFYKCMFPTCSYHTNSYEKFTVHLKRASHKGIHECCYCLFKGNARNLNLHNWKAHGMCFYACSQCFYRGIDRFLVYQHIVNHHKELKDRDNLILFIKSGTHKYTVDLDLALRQRAKHFRPIKCTNNSSDSSQNCSVLIYDIGKFVIHQRTHHAGQDRSILNYRCAPCNDDIPLSNLRLHLIKIHGINRFHCLWCHFSAQNIQELRVHLADEHSNRPPIYCDRSGCLTNESMSLIVPTDIFMLKCSPPKNQLSIIKLT